MTSMELSTYVTHTYVDSSNCEITFRFKELSIFSKMEIKKMQLSNLHFRFHFFLRTFHRHVETGNRK